jgi:hypothetical protein
VHAKLYPHKVALLDENAARQLFLRSASLESVPQGLEAVANNILAACGGMPLALRRMGSQLFNTSSVLPDEDLWLVCPPGLGLCFEGISLEPPLGHSNIQMVLYELSMNTRPVCHSHSQSSLC